ncbi:MAG TPA: hypothetical protein PLT69_13355, partial [Deltaproteobacteria bacterium]|nr:hypothetical protein [Deltaproteobacteria bacterium]
MRRLILTFTFAAIASLVMSACSTSSTTGLLRGKDSSHALIELLRQAESGDSQAQFNVGLIHC